MQPFPLSSIIITSLLPFSFVIFQKADIRSIPRGLERKVRTP